MCAMWELHHHPYGAYRPLWSSPGSDTICNILGKLYQDIVRFALNGIRAMDHEDVRLLKRGRDVSATSIEEKNEAFFVRRVFS